MIRTDRQPAISTVTASRPSKLPEQEEQGCYDKEERAAAVHARGAVVRYMLVGMLIHSRSCEQCRDHRGNRAIGRRQVRSVMAGEQPQADEHYGQP